MPLAERMDRQRRAQLVERQSAELRHGHRRGARRNERHRPAAREVRQREGRRRHQARPRRVRRTSSRRSSTPARSCRWPRCRSASTATCRRARSADPRKSKTDIAVSRFFAIPGRQSMRLQFRGELFNAFNQVNFNAPITTANSANFGRILAPTRRESDRSRSNCLW